MKNNFNVKLLKFSNLKEIPERRTHQDYLSLLEKMDFDDINEIAPEELEEMCLMSLQDLEPVGAAELVLSHDLGNILKHGQIKNIANEMLDEKLWEEYADPSLHEAFFNIGSLLYKSFPKSFPFPDAACVEISITATNEVSETYLEKHLNESFLVRLVADGVDDSSILRRLYHEQLLSKSFPEAESIIWILSSEKIDETSIKVNMISSGYWFDSIKNAKEYVSSAYADSDDE